MMIVVAACTFLFSFRLVVVEVFVFVAAFAVVGGSSISWSVNGECWVVVLERSTVSD